MRFQIFDRWRNWPNTSSIQIYLTLPRMKVASSCIFGLIVSGRHLGLSGCDGRRIPDKDGNISPFYLFLSPNENIFHCISGGSFLPHSASGRTFICSWWFFSIIVVATYGGSLIAYLTISKLDAPFDDLEGLVRQDRYKWGFKEGTVYYTAFKVGRLGILVD